MNPCHNLLTIFFGAIVILYKWIYSILEIYFNLPLCKF